MILNQLYNFPNYVLNKDIIGCNLLGGYYHNLCTIMEDVYKGDNIISQFWNRGMHWGPWLPRLAPSSTASVSPIIPSPLSMWQHGLALIQTWIHAVPMHCLPGWSGCLPLPPSHLYHWHCCKTMGFGTHIDTCSKFLQQTFLQVLKSLYPASALCLGTCIKAI